jgi:hypothetical protein
MFLISSQEELDRCLTRLIIEITKVDISLEAYHSVLHRLISNKIPPSDSLPEGVVDYEMSLEDFANFYLIAIAAGSVYGENFGYSKNGDEVTMWMKIRFFNNRAYNRQSVYRIAQRAAREVRGQILLPVESAIVERELRSAIGRIVRKRSANLAKIWDVFIYKAGGKKEFDRMVNQLTEISVREGLEIQITDVPGVKILDEFKEFLFHSDPESLSFPEE